MLAAAGSPRSIALAPSMVCDRLKPSSAPCLKLAPTLPSSCCSTAPTVSPPELTLKLKLPRPERKVLPSRSLSSGALLIASSPTFMSYFHGLLRVSRVLCVILPP